MKLIKKITVFVIFVVNKTIPQWRNQFVGIVIKKIGVYLCIKHQT